MSLVLKLFGMLVLLLSSTALGFFKAIGLKRRSENLQKICFALGTLRERLCLGGSRESLIAECFPAEALRGEALNINDKSILSEFLDGFGSNVSGAEIERINHFRELFAQQLTAAEQSRIQGGRLYKTIGFCTGLCACIFLI